MIKKIRLLKSAHALNDAIAQQNRNIFTDAKLTVLNMISSPGSGKTSILEILGKSLGNKLFVITGDIQTQLDKERILASGAHAVQIETHGSCHLTSHMINTIVEASCSTTTPMTKTGNASRPTASSPRTRTTRISRRTWTSWCRSLRIGGKKNFSFCSRCLSAPMTRAFLARRISRPSGAF